MILSSREAETRSPAALNAAMRRQANGTRLSVGFILTRRFTLCAFANFIDVLRLAADEGDRSRQILCDWKILSNTMEAVSSSSGVTVQPNERLGDPAKFDYIVVVGGLVDGLEIPVHDRAGFAYQEVGSKTHNLNRYPRYTGGLLVQEADLALYNELKVVTKRAPTEAEMADLLFAWRVAKFVKSNAIVYAKGKMTIGVGAGQMSRINSARIAAIKAEHAGLQVSGSVMASDAFFPFRDGIDSAAQSGIVAVIQPGGSMRDEEVIAAANEHGMAMVFTGMRHFRH